MDVYIVYNNDDTLKKLGDTLEVSPFFIFIDERSKKGKKEAHSLKTEWGARETPFALCLINGKPVKAFYSEAEDVVTNLVKYLNSK